MRLQFWLAIGLLTCGACQKTSAPVTASATGTAPAKAPDPRISELIESLDDLLTIKGTVIPYSAEYELALPPAPHIAGTQEQRRVVELSRDALYSEEVWENHSSRVLIRNGTIKLSYEDDQLGKWLFQGAAILDRATPEQFLIGRGFPTNTRTPLDAALPGYVTELLSDAEVLSDELAKESRRVTLATHSLGNVRVTVEQGVFRLDGINGDNADRPLFRYEYHVGLPEWTPDPVAELEDAFTVAAAGKVRQLSATFSYAELFAAMNQETGMQPIPLPTLPDVAHRLGYFLPAGGQAVILQASGVTAEIPLRSLNLTITTGGGETISILQHIPPMQRNDLPDGFVRQERQSGDFLVVEVVDQGANGRFVYYFGTEVSFIIPDQQFEVRQLDAIVLGFRRSGANE
jgi:hypothetical protein